MFASRFIHTRRSGNILLLALLMLAGGLVGGLTVAALVLGELRQATALDNGLMAYAQAESGLEQSLYNVRQDKMCDSGPCNDSDYVPTGLPMSTTTGTTTYRRKISPANILSVPYLNTDQNFQLDFTPPLAASCSSPVNITVGQWSRTSSYCTNLAKQACVTDADCGGVVGTCITNPHPALEVSYIEQPPLGGNFQVSRPALGLPYDCGASVNNLPCQPITTLTFPLNAPSNCVEPNNTQLYQVRVRALNAPISDLRFDLSGNNSNYLDVWSQGRQGSTNQTLKTTVPKHPPAYGFSDYVIFSEQDIVK